MTEAVPTTDLGAVAAAAPPPFVGVATGVRVAEFTEADKALILDEAMSLIDRAGSASSARDGATRRQKVGAALAVALCVAAAIVSPGWTARVLVGACTATYLGALWYRVRLVATSLSTSPGHSVPDDVALAVSDDDLPSYAVLVPAYREPEVIGGLLVALEQLDYPRHKLEIVLLLEHDDVDTLAAARAYDALAPSSLAVTVMVLPSGTPQTKPRALNFGFVATDSDLVTIYDAEDRPERLQLRRAAVAFSQLDDSVGCLQARLEFDDRGVNLLSKWFTLEYLTWFRMFIGGITASGGVVPLGGTSNHFRRSALDAVGAWDAHNVTEDADLGVRLERSGFGVGLLDSVTLEEVNSDVVNWVKQRSRWMKGYLQTSIVHTREPRRLVRELGVKRTAGLLLFLAGTPMLALLNVVFWTLFATWAVTKADAIEYLFPSVVYYLALVSLVIGNLTMVYLSVVTVVHTRRHDHLLVAALLTPMYWLLISIATIRAAIQLVTDPFHWEKTQHGIGLAPVSGE